VRPIAPSWIINFHDFLSLNPELDPYGAEIRILLIQIQTREREQNVSIRAITNDLRIRLFFHDDDPSRVGRASRIDQNATLQMFEGATIDPIGRIDRGIANLARDRGS
jgi:hypothetical protein